MNQRASLQITTSKRGPPRHRHVPDAPVGGYHVTTANQPTPSDFSLRDHPREIEIAIAAIQELDKQMLQLEHEITHHRAILDDPSSDGWDRIDAEKELDPLIERHTSLRWQVIQRAGEIGTHCAYLIGDWKDDELAAIGRAMAPDVLDRVLAECPGIETSEGWQVICREAVPF